MTPPTLTFLAKLGGSITTCPDADGRVHEPRLRALARALAPHAEAGLILVHGTGHVGKPAAVRYGFERTGRVEAARASIALRIKNDLAELNTRVVRILLDAGLPAVSMRAEDHLPVGEPDADPRPERLAAALEAGLVPVLHGDMVRATAGAWRVLSSDEILERVAERLRPRFAAFLTDVDGVLGVDDEGREALLPDLDDAALARVARRGSDDRDVSGGMRAKVAAARRTAAFSGSCHILDGTDPARLAALLRGESPPGTRIHPPRSTDGDGRDERDATGREPR